jgi:hypothetical protein
MNRRPILLGCLSAVLPLATPRAATAWGIPWARIPAVAVWSLSGDPRIPLVQDAVTFWNQTLAGLGSGFRLGAVTVTSRAIPADELKAMSEATLGRLGPPAMPEWLNGISGQIVVALSDGDFVSFTNHWAETALIGIRSERFPPLTLPNVARNVIAHELGHAIGLGHNSDERLLMCGRPASCRPTAFQSSTEHYFPLADDEKALLLRLYPAGWRPR